MPRVAVAPKYWIELPIRVDNSTEPLGAILGKRIVAFCPRAHVESVNMWLVDKFGVEQVSSVPLLVYYIIQTDDDDLVFALFKGIKSGIIDQLMIDTICKISQVI
jgi:hypothetical protein